ncbi:unnamed protein product [Calypogeia fissa]
MEMRTILPALVVATILLGNGISSVQGTKEFVLVHGAAHGAWCWYKVATILQKAGYKVTTLDMLSAGTRDKINADTVTTVAQHSKPLLDYLACNVSHEVVLVGHSIAGVTITFAMEQYPEKISHAIFLAASMPANNQSQISSLLPSSIPSLLVQQVSYFNYANGPTAPPTSFAFNLTVAAQFFYNQSPDTDITLSLTLLDNEPYCSLVEVLILTKANYGRVRRFYIQTDKDNIWGPGGEEYVLSNNPPEKSFFIKDTDHSAFFSKPIETAAYIVQISKL